MAYQGYNIYIYIYKTEVERICIYTSPSNGPWPLRTLMYHAASLVNCISKLSLGFSAGKIGISWP